MACKKIAIVDYNVGNLLNVVNACHYLGQDAELVDTPEAIKHADYLILPGVGSCHDGMNGLEQKGFVDAIHEHCQTGKGLLGICLGMQLLADSSDEGGLRSTLGLIPGQVKAIPRLNSAGCAVTVPNINWLKLHLAQSNSTNEENFGFAISRFLQEQYFYFVHSYYFEAIQPRQVVAVATHQGIEINAVVRKDNVIGCQFHPEKSAKAGLDLLQHLLNID